MDKAVLARTFVARRTGYGGKGIPIGGPDEGMTNASSDSESARTTLGVEQPQGFVWSPTEPSENQHPLHTEEELDGDQSRVFHVFVEKSRGCVPTSTKFVSKGKFFYGNPRGATRIAKSKPVWR